MAAFDVVIPTVGRPSLPGMVEALLAGPGPRPQRVLVVDDRRHPEDPLPPLPEGVEVVTSGGRGPAAARNAGWRAGEADWVAFLDDDVVPEPGWRADLARDLDAAPPSVGGVQGRITVPLPPGRRPSDWERNVARLETARWATADMAYRRAALVAVGGFDERFPRAFREDADLGARVVAAGWQIVEGTHGSAHPVRPSGPWVSVRLQAGNADDVLMRAIHGARWRELTGAPPGRRRRHLAITMAAAGALAGVATRRSALAAAAGAAWAAGTAELAWARIRPGPRTLAEVATMVATSAAIPPAASFHWIRGWITLPGRLRQPARQALPGTHP